MQQQSDLHATLRETIRRSGHRLTPQRQIIFEAVHELGGHCTPDDVYHRVQLKNDAINRATVYRALEFFVEQGLLTTAHLQSNQVVYELAGAAPHHHIICRKCDQLVEIDHSMVAPLFAEIEKTLDFVVLTNHLVLFGLCAHCQQAEAEEST